MIYLHYINYTFNYHYYPYLNYPPSPNNNI